MYKLDIGTPDDLLPLVPLQKHPILDYLPPFKGQFALVCGYRRNMADVPIEINADEPVVERRVVCETIADVTKMNTLYANKRIVGLTWYANRVVQFQEIPESQRSEVNRLLNAEIRALEMP